jgi:hypothetical protein
MVNAAVNEAEIAKANPSVANFRFSNAGRKLTKSPGCH